MSATTISIMLAALERGHALYEEHDSAKPLCSREGLEVRRQRAMQEIWAQRDALSQSILGEQPTNLQDAVTILALAHDHVDALNCTKETDGFRNQVAVALQNVIALLASEGNVMPNEGGWLESTINFSAVNSNFRKSAGA